MSGVEWVAWSSYASFCSASLSHRPLTTVVCTASEVSYSWRGIGQQVYFSADDLVSQFWEIPANFDAALIHGKTRMVESPERCKARNQ